MLIRPAIASDLPAIAEMWNAMIRDTTATFTSVEKSESDLAALLTARAKAFFVAEVAGKCAGFITWGAFRAGPGYAHTAEHTIIVDVKGAGVGRALMDAAVEAARGQRIHVLIAAIGGENTVAVAFHNRMGFAKSACLPQVGRKSGRWHDLILMSRIIAAP